MASDAGQQLAVIFREFDEAVETAMIGITLGTVAGLKRAPSEGGTPVDTGWARANWVPSIGDPVDHEVGSREAVDASAQTAGEGKLPGYRLQMGKIWITNNVPYITRLNAGSSPQAEPGFVERNITEAIGKAERGFPRT